MDSTEIQELLDAATQGDADEAVADDAGQIVVARFGTLLVSDDCGELRDEEFLTEAAAADAFTQQKEQLS